MPQTPGMGNGWRLINFLSISVQLTNRKYDRYLPGAFPWHNRATGGEDMSEVGGIIGFGRYEVDLRACELRRNNRPVKLQNQVFRLLMTFLQHRGEVLTRDQLKTRIWPSNEFIDFDNG